MTRPHFPAVDPDTKLPSAAVQAAWANITSIASKVDKGALVFNVKDYGALGTYNGTSGSDDTTAIQSAVTALQATGGCGTIFFPPTATGLRYRSTQPLPSISGIRYAGTNRKTTRIQFIDCDIFNITGTLSELIIEGIYLSVSGGHVFNLVSNASAYYNTVRDCIISIQSTDKSIVFQNGSGDYIENYWLNLDTYRLQTATVPAFYIRNSGGGANANVWKRIRANSANCTSSPFWYIESTVDGAYAHDNTFEDIVGEQNPAGLIHIYTNQGTHIRNCYDWDSTVTYVDHVIKIAKSATSVSESKSITVQNSGRRGGTLGASIYDVSASGGSRAVSLIGVGNSTNTPVTLLPSKGGYTSDHGALRVAAGDVIQTGRDTTANRPSASTAGVGAMFYDTTLSKPIWSTGTVWKDATGTTV